MPNLVLLQGFSVPLNSNTGGLLPSWMPRVRVSSPAPCPPYLVEYRIGVDAAVYELLTLVPLTETQGIDGAH
jgi:hypothetical protein